MMHIEYHLGRYQCVATSNGIADRRNVGPRFSSPREAARFLDSMAAIPDVSPLRDPEPRKPAHDLAPFGDGTSRDIGLASGAPETGSIPRRHDEGSAAEPAAGFWATPPTESGG